jgi:murein DD-endopeptidase MepM/ murein hydrolase activator NlpD
MTPSEKLKKHMSNKLTVMLIPHSNGQPIRINFSVAFLSMLAVGWTGLTIWSGFIASRHVDYWRAKTSEQVLRAKVWYFSQEMKRSREYLDRVRETEIALQNLLNMKTKKAIVEKGGAMGGPTSGDRKELTRAVQGTPITLDEMSSQLEVVKRDGSDVVANFEEISKFIQDQHEVFRATPLDWPTKGRLTSHFGHRKSPFENVRGEFHAGLDIANKAGTPVHATADGKVFLASWQGGYGRLVILDHGRGFRTYYGHNSELLVKPGDKVKRGQVIAKMGTSGHSTGDHLHYEVWHNGRVVNPMKFVKVEKE